MLRLSCFARVVRNFVFYGVPSMTVSFIAPLYVPAESVDSTSSSKKLNLRCDITRQFAVDSRMVVELFVPVKLYAPEVKLL